MKKLIFSSLVGLALVAFTGCTDKSGVEADAKCSASSKCSGDKTTKCSGDKAKKVATKCSTSGKCGK